MLTRDLFLMLPRVFPPAADDFLLLFLRLAGDGTGFIGVGFKGPSTPSSTSSLTSAVFLRVKLPLPPEI